MSTYNKPYRTFEQQLELLKSRGLEVTNDSVALEYLRRLGYYRLSGYWYPCRKLIPFPAHQSKPVRPQREDGFMSGARFQDAVELYVFDKKLRLLILDAIERVEVAFRVDIAYLLGKKGPRPPFQPVSHHATLRKTAFCKAGLGTVGNFFMRYSNKLLGFCSKKRSAAVVLSRCVIK